MRLKRLVRYFLRGLLVTAPLGLTVYIVWLVLSAIDRLMPFPIPGLGLVATLVLITLIGIGTSNVVGRTLVDLADALFGRLPLVKLVYTSIKDLVDAFVGDKRRFDVPASEVMTFIISGGISGFGIGESILPPEPSSTAAA